MTQTGETDVVVIVNTSPLTASPVIEKYDGIMLPDPYVVWIVTGLK